MLPLLWQEAELRWWYSIGGDCKYGWNFTGSLAAHLLLCSWVPNMVLVLGPGLGDPCSVGKENLRSQAKFSIVPSLSSFYIWITSSVFLLSFLTLIFCCCCYFVDCPSIWVRLMFPCSEIQAKQFLQEYLMWRYNLLSTSIRKHHFC